MRHEATLSEKESLQKGYQELETQRDALVLQVTIIKGEKNVVESTNKDPKFLASVNISIVQSNVDNFDKLVEDAEHYKERRNKMKYTLVKERGEGR